MPINETQLNGRIATLLDRMNARWSAYGETHGAFEGNQLQPDILVHQRTPRHHRKRVPPRAHRRTRSARKEHDTPIHAASCQQ